LFPEAKKGGICTNMFMQILISALVLGSTYGLIALGYSIIYKASGLLNFSQGDFLTLGAFLGYTFYSILDLPFVVALVATILTVFVFGIVLEKYVIRKLLDKQVLAIYVVLATIAVSYIIQNGSWLIWGTKILNFPLIFKVSRIKVAGLNIQLY
jgi:branched-chain amino acid transport system permease protein